MSITTVSSREFNQDVSKVKRASQRGPVFITDRGHPSYVLLAIKDYQKLTKTKENIVELLAMPDDATDVEFDPPKSTKKMYRPEDFD